jgi:Ca2+-binding EF-hand superfamily protein
MFATAGSKFMTFNEVMNCLKTFNFNLQHVEKLALMKRIDADNDNQITREEFYHALASAGTASSTGAQSPSRMDDSEDRRVDQALLKIKQGAARYKSLQEYCLDLMRRLDRNKDGYITFVELSEGLRDMGIKIFKGEQAALMRRLDEDRDGVICYDELYKALRNA